MIFKRDKLRQIVAAYDNVFNTPEGKIVLAHLVSENYVLSPTFDDRNPDPTSLAFKEGQRNAILGILEMLNVKPEELLSLVKDVEDAIY